MEGNNSQHTLATKGQGIEGSAVNGSIVAAVDYWANKTPNVIAVESSEGSYSYQQLAGQIDIVAASLKAAGVERGDVVAMCLPRTKDVWPIFLAIFKVGAIYLPLDPSWPKGRIQSAIVQSSCRYLVVVEPSDELQSCTQLLLPALMAGDEGELKKGEAVTYELAYIIFTSGSTGQPKGVQISHDSLMHLLKVMSEQLSLNSSLRQLCLASFAFDLVIPDLFLPLIVGGCCVLDLGEGMQSPEKLIEQLELFDINLLQATPATYQHLCDNDWAGRQQLQAIIGGDKVTPVLAEQLSQKVAVLWHCYGPTEATVWSAVNRYDEQNQLAFSAPLPGYHFYLVDDAGNLLHSPGDRGELLIAGQGLSQGYIGLPDLTQQKFIDVDFGNGAEKVYRTGDIFQYDQAKLLVYIGRKDNQIKVSGHRVELGEIEVVAQQVEGINKFVAELLNGQIYGYYQAAAANDSRLADALKKHMAEKLPWYMLPTHYIAVDKFPLTANQKVDRKTLVQLSGEAQLQKTAKISGPQADYLEDIKQAWFDAFAYHIDENKNIFDDGADSLKVVSLLVAIEQRLQINLPLSFAYTNPNLVEMAAALVGWADVPLSDGSAQLIRLQKGDDTPLVCIHPVGGGVYHYRLIAQYLGCDVPVYGVQAQGYDGTKPLYHVVDMAHCYANLISKQFATGPVRLLGGSMGGVLAIETAKRLVELGVQVEQVYLLDSLAKVSAKSQSGAALTPSKIWKGLRLRLQDKLLGGRAKLTFAAGKRLSNVHRYKYIHLINLMALSQYFSGEDYKISYSGRVVLMRLPLQKSGPYAEKYLGWRPVLEAEPQVVYVEGSHAKFLESKKFAKAFKANY